MRKGVNCTVTTKRGEIRFGTTNVPNRTSIALYRQRGAQLEVLAWFRSVEDAERFERILFSIGDVVRTLQNALPVSKSEVARGG